MLQQIRKRVGNKSGIEKYKYERGSKLGCTCFAEVRVKLSVFAVVLLRRLSNMKLSRFTVSKRNIKIVFIENSVRSDFKTNQNFFIQCNFSS